MEKDDRVIGAEEVEKRKVKVANGISQRKARKTNNKKKKKLEPAKIKKYSMTELDHVILKIKANEVKYTIVSVLIILAVFLVIAYMIFSSVQEHVDHNVLKNGNLYIEFEERDIGLGDIIDLVDVETYSDEKDVPDTYKVTITNDSEEARKYQILIEDDSDMIEIDNCQNIFLDRSFLRYSINGGPTMVLGAESDDSIVFGTLDGKKSVTYTIKVWVSDTYFENPHYHGKIVVKQINDEEKDQNEIVLED